ncbi:MAG: TMEM165/GDT1 family protein [Methylococcaceae bacterium]|nr:TMEM165/GDT1 family protein [Methylococcaceae bacterium]
MENVFVYLHDIVTYLSSLKIIDLSATASTSFFLIFAAEIGDKSQLVCMTLAARHRLLPVLLGAITSFAFLNGLAVIFGAAIANWFSDYVVSISVAVLFAIFGFHSLFSTEEEEGGEMVEKSGHHLFFTTFLLITFAEFGDKTQLAVVALSSTGQSVAVWIGATSALILTSTLGVVAGTTLLKKVPLALLHKISGFIFLILAMFAAYRAYSI